MFVFGLPPTVSIMYGAPNTWSPRTWKWFSERPMIRVSRSVYGPVPSQFVSARNSDPAGCVRTSR